jgi:hypothetical protein
VDDEDKEIGPMAFASYNRSIADILRDVIVQATTLLRKEIELARGVPGPVLRLREGHQVGSPKILAISPMRLDDRAPAREIRLRSRH